MVIEVCFETLEVDLPESISELLFIAKDKSDNDLAAEISETFFNEHRDHLIKVIKDDKERVDKLERQKANLMREKNDLKKSIKKLEKYKSKAQDNNKEDDLSESISGTSSDIKTPRSEDMVTIDRLKKQNEELEEKIKDTKKKDKEEKNELLKKLNEYEAEIDDKTYKLQTLKDSLCDQFKRDIDKLRKSFEKEQKVLEKALLEQKEKEIEKISKLKEKEYQYRISTLENNLAERSDQCEYLEKTLETQQNQRNLMIKHENENKLKILKENRATFTIAFDNITLKNAPRRMDEQVNMRLMKTLDIGLKDLRLISINSDERLENDRTTSITVFLYEIISDGKSNQTCKELSFPPLSCLNKLRVQIRDGTSLLYDLHPIYVGINIGSVFGFPYEQPIDDYYLLKREGVYFGEKQLLVTILKHPQHYFKVLAYDVSTNEDFTLSLDTHDIIELASTPTAPSESPSEVPLLNYMLESDAELGNLIIDCLTLIKKETQIFMVCEQRLYFESHSHFKRSISDKLMEDHIEKQSSKRVSMHRSIGSLSDNDKEVQQINVEHRSLTKDQPEKYRCSARQQQCTQTMVDDNILYERYINVLENQVKSYCVGVYDVDIKISKGHHSRNLFLEFEVEMTSHNTSKQDNIHRMYNLKCLLFQVEEKKNQSNEVDLGRKKSTDHHLAYLGYIRPTDNDCLIVSVEQFLSPLGIHIKLHDLNKKVSTIIFLEKKHIDSSDEMIYVETDQDRFAIRPNSIRNEMSELFSVPSAILNPGDQIMIPKIPKKRQDKSLSLISDDDQTSYSYTSAQNAFNVDKIFTEKSKGKLIYRELVKLRYVYDTSQSIMPPQESKSQIIINDQKQHEREISCLISFYKDLENDDLINIEIVTKDLNITISSQVSESVVFESKPKLELAKKVEILNSMIEQMFIYYENSEYVLRTESKAIPMPEFIKKKQRENLKNARTEHELAKSSEERKNYTRRKERMQTLIDFNDDWKDDVAKLERYYVVSNQLCKLVAYFIDEPEQENLKPTTSKQLRSQISGKSVINRRLNANVSQLGAMSQDITAVYLEAEFIIKDKCKSKLKRLLLSDDLRDYLFGALQSDIDFVNSPDKKQQILDVICQNIILKNNKLVMTNDETKSKQNDLGYQSTDFAISLNKTKLLEGMSLQGVGGAMYTKEQVDVLKRNLDESMVDKRLILNQEFVFSEHTHDVKVYKVLVKDKDTKNEVQPTTYIIETFELNSPHNVYSCHLSTKKLKGKACRLIIDCFNPKPRSSSSTDFNESEIQRIVDKYTSYNIVVAIFEQSFPQCIMFHKELSNFFIIDNITFVLFEPNSSLKWRYNIHDIKSYEYCEGDVMYKYINSFITSLYENKKYQMLDSSDKIEEITEEISDLSKFDQNSRMYCISAPLDPDFHQEVERPSKSSSIYYSYLASMKDNQVRKKKIFFKAYNIGLGDDKELSINMVFNVYLCSNDTLRVTLALTDLIEKNRQEPVNHEVNFIKQPFLNGSKVYSELIRYKEFFFIVQISMATLDSFQASGVCVDLSCTTNEDRINVMVDDIPSPIRLCSIFNIDKIYIDAHESSMDDSSSPKKFEKSRSVTESNNLLKTSYIPIFKYAVEEFKNMFGSVGDEVAKYNLMYDDFNYDSHEKLLHRKTFFDDSSNLVVIIEIRTEERGQDEEGFNLIISEPEAGNKQEFKIYFKDCFTRRELEFLATDDILSLKRLAINMVDERISFNKSSNGDYKIQILTTEDLLKRQQEQNEVSVSSEEDPKSAHSMANVKDMNISEGVKTITEELSKPPSESNYG